MQTNMDQPFFPFYSDKKFGFFDRNFQVAIPAIYASGDPWKSDFGVFSEGFALVRRTDWRYAFVNKNGNELTNDAWCWRAPEKFSEGLAAVQIEELWGFIDTQGAIAIDPKFQWVDSFSDGLAEIRTADREFLGFVNKNGDWVVEKGRYTNASSFSSGLACA